MDTETSGEAVSEAIDWRVAARAEYRTTRADLQKKVAAAVKAEQRAATRRTNLEKQLADLDAGAKAFGLETGQGDGATGADGGHPAAEGSVREIIMTALEAAFPKGLKARELKKIIEQRLGREVHYKTPGMTLYRLAEAGDVHREGYNWFLMHPPARYVPGHDAPHDFVVDPDDDEDDQPPEQDDWDRVDWDLVQQQEDRMTGG